MDPLSILELARPGEYSTFESTEAARLRWIYQFEPLAAAILLIVLSPVIIALGVAIWILSRRSPIIRHGRVGWRGTELRMLKFRTMWARWDRWSAPFAIEDVTGAVPVLKSSKDARVTHRFAAWCRKYSLDELPQLVHIARGEMSFVGPRPITREEMEMHYGRSSHAVLLMRPGLTGLWQVSGRNKLTYPQRRRLDTLYTRTASPGLYFRILFRSIPRVIRGHGSY